MGKNASAILADAHSYFLVSSFKCEGKYSCHDLSPNPRRLFVEICLRCHGLTLNLAQHIL